MVDLRSVSSGGIDLAVKGGSSCVEARTLCSQVANWAARYYREGSSHDAGEISMGVILVLLARGGHYRICY